MKILTLLILLISNNSFSQVHKVGKDEFLKKIDQNKITFSILPAAREIGIATLMKISQLETTESIDEKSIKVIENAIIQDNVAKFAYFQPEMMNVRYFQDGPWRYSITFDFHTTRKCTFRVEKIDFTCGNPCCNPKLEDPRQCANADIEGKIIPDSYCEKIYGIKIKSSLDKK
jgi:hypothetical protein